MRIHSTNRALAECGAQAVVVGVYEDGLRDTSEKLDDMLDGALGFLTEEGEIRGTLGEVTPLLGNLDGPAGVVVALGLGPRDKLDARGVRHAAGAAALWLAARPREWVDYRLDLPRKSLHLPAILGAMAGCDGCGLHQNEPQLHAFDTLFWHGAHNSILQRAEATGEGIRLAKELVNQPASHIYPETFAEWAREAAKESGLEIEVWDQRRLEDERCGSLLAVARGSARPPRMVILHHRGAAADKPTLGLVGKGVTFDSGGLSLKPTDSMKLMKCDMAGAAAVLGAMQAIAQLKLPINVVGVCGLVENMVSGDSYKLGDVLTARNERTIEVLNTDAEGRLVLADALDVAIEKGADRLIDLATLTGACVVALGTETAGLMTNDQAWCKQVAAAAERAGERMWQLPMHPEYGELIRSQVADIKNVGEGRWAGAITAAKFLEQFVEDTPWTHIDIAGPAFLDSPKPWHPAGGTGAAVPTLVELAVTLGSEK